MGILRKYGEIKKALIPTEQAANVVLIILLVITVLVLLKGTPVAKAAWSAWLVLP